MIVRQGADGHLILISQTDHSRLVGQFAAHWGNDRFAVPRPYESVARAAAFHDFGWLRYETAPLYDAETGETPPFFRVPGGVQQLEAYRWCRNELLIDDPYAGMLVGMHRTGLWRGRYNALTHPSHALPKSLSPETEEFIDRAETVQAVEAATFGATQAWTNYQLLQVWDQLGLYFTCQEPYPQYIEPVPTEYAAKNFVGLRMTMTPETPSRVAFAPYPFDVRPLSIQFPRRHLSAGRFADTAAFRRAWFQAPLELVEFELV